MWFIFGKKYLGAEKKEEKKKTEGAREAVGRPMEGSYIFLER